MTNDQKKEAVKPYIEDYLREKGLPLKGLFRCVNPAHGDNKPSMGYHREAQRVHCFSCGESYDLIDLIGIYEGLDRADSFKYAYRKYLGDDDMENNPKQPKTTQNNPIQPKTTENFNDVIETAYQELKSNPEALRIIQNRGLIGMIDRYKIGYHDRGINDLLEKNHPENMFHGRKDNLYKFVLPFPDQKGDCGYFMVEISDRNQIDDYNGKYKKIKGVPAEIFNERYIKAKEPPEVVFICEGVYDALSVEEMGGKAIALNGIGTNRFIDICEKYKPKTAFVMALDNDARGKETSEKLTKELQGKGFLVRSGNKVFSFDGCKDVNDALKSDKGLLYDKISEMIQGVKEELNGLEAEKISSYKKEKSIQGKAVDLLKNVMSGQGQRFIPSGFDKLDNILDGGFRPWMYVIGAVTSLGKTTFCLQIADQIAQSGQDVLIFSLEMPEDELIARSVSRLTLLEDRKRSDGLSKANAKTTVGILTGSYYSGYTNKEIEVITEAFRQYYSYSDHIFIHHGIGNITVDNIVQVIDDHIRITGKKPFVLIDYLQIIASPNPRLSDKQAVDQNITALKRYSSMKEVCILGISSFNRENYQNPVNFSSFKESGSIEYSSDVVLGLQLDCMKKQVGEKDSERQARIEKEIAENEASIKQGGRIKINLKIIKARNGQRGSVDFDYYPKFNLYEEATDRWTDRDQYNRNNWVKRE